MLSGSEFKTDFERCKNYSGFLLWRKTDLAFAVSQASQGSWDRRAELDVRLAIPSAQSACGMEIFTKNGMAVSAMPFFVVKGTSCGKAMYK